MHRRFVVPPKQNVEHGMQNNGLDIFNVFHHMISDDSVSACWLANDKAS
jgi:hypothetical protein